MELVLIPAGLEVACEGVSHYPLSGSRTENTSLSRYLIVYSAVSKFNHRKLQLSGACVYV